MPAFEYEAFDAHGKTRKGVLSADSRRDAGRALRDQGLTPVTVSGLREGETAGRSQVKKKPRVRPGELVVMTRQLAVLLESSLPLEEALHAAAMQTDSSAARSRILAVRERVVEGWRFSDALGEDPQSFSSLYRSVVAAGETSGDLGRIMERLALMLEKNRAIRNRALASLIYPAALAIVAAGVVTALMVFVVPGIVDQFTVFDAQLPLLTRVVVGLSGFILDYGLYLLAVSVVAGAGVWRLLKEKPCRLFADRQILRLPVIGRLARAMDGARFARTLATLFMSGAPLLDSLLGARRTVSSSWIGERLEVSITMVGEGASVAASLKRANVLPAMLIHMAAAGERAGALPGMLEKAAQQLEEEFDTASGVALRLLEPVIIVVMGGAVAVIVLSIMLPILQLNSLAAG